MASRKEEILLFTSLIDEKTLINELDKAIQKHKATGDNIHQVRMYCTLIGTKELLSLKGFAETLEEINTIASIMRKMYGKES
jgi:hypothetical protein